MKLDKVSKGRTSPRDSGGGGNPQDSGGRTSLQILGGGVPPSPQHSVLKYKLFIQGLFITDPLGGFKAVLRIRSIFFSDPDPRIRF